MTVFHSAIPRAVSHQSPRSARVAVVLVAATLASIAPALWAQPAAPSWGVIDPKAVKAEADNFLQTRFLPLSETDPKAALALATNYLANTTLPSPARVALRMQIANHLYFNKANALPAQQRPAFTDAVLALVNEGISEVGDEPVSAARNASLLQMHEVALNILLDDKRWPAAQKQLEAAWPLALPMQDMSAWIERGKRLYREQEQPEKIAPMLIQTVQGRLMARKRLDLALCLQVSQQLAAQKQGEEALQWAKLVFVGSNVDARWIQNATSALTAAWTASGTPEKAQAFIAAQARTDAPNPLDAVALPSFDARAVEAALSNEGGAVPAEDRLTVLLGLGRWNEALTLARGLGLNDPRSKKAALQMARVFKGHDGSLARANQYLSYVQSGAGENPLPALVAEVATS